MIARPFRRAGLFCLLAVPLVFSLALPGSKTGPEAGRVFIPAGKSAAGPGLKVHVDPATGRIIPPPAQAAPDAATAARFSSTHEGLVEEPGRTAAGGFIVEARGRFRSAVTLQTGPDGKPILNCADGTKEPPQRRE